MFSSIYELNLIINCRAWRNLVRQPDVGDERDGEGVGRASQVGRLPDFLEGEAGAPDFERCSVPCNTPIAISAN